ncbi:MAG: magnesium transporter CorA family protein [Pseudotabrizicola sp.]|uniref:magnesium transporter CorA family protein n=1 Tax=Pseudotabrizicola sp. TaxID=2939647 RepID=UPI00271B64A1|nr:magnesium transporter CorA family protein [Pseudotabrizicola sp.]MDO8884065.1 magnesium transporter CorA family protein [Pseudotabrizicola sp.]MDP2083390.1 magnesium transporter CorA family protein [Pseudotabrizicola sp.]MDZ7574928.1 magnesium transporter CorA family protein [Pseudotabrizicola sp.]
MLFAYRPTDTKLEKLPNDGSLDEAVWIDLYQPLDAQVLAAQAMGIEVPTLADMEEIEISNRLYRENGFDYMTVVLPGMSETNEPISGPVTFIMTPERLFTVRHHAPRPFTTYPERANKVGPGCTDSARLFLSLLEEVTGRLADLLEGSGRALDALAREVYSETGTTDAAQLQGALRRTGREGEQIARVRLSLLTIERAVSYFGQSLTTEHRGTALKGPVKGLMRDLHALEVHADHLSARVALASDSTMGMINLSQSQTIKIVSVVAVVFLPPTVIASAYGMNFEVMPELQWTLGYPMALSMMVASAVGTYLFFKWRRWL